MFSEPLWAVIYVCFAPESGRTLEQAMGLRFAEKKGNIITQPICYQHCHQTVGSKRRHARRL